MLKDVDDFIQEIKSLEEKIYLILSENIFESSSPADYAKKLINTENANENKEAVAKREDRRLGLKDRIKEMSEAEKKYKNVDETLKIIK